MQKDIYVRISDKEKVIEFSDEWSEVSAKNGKKKKFKGNEYRKLVKYIIAYWRGYTEHEIEKWKAPEWIKTEHFKINHQNNVYVTINNHGDIKIEFEANGIPIIISKPPIFYELYDRYLYIYEKILFIAQTANFKEIKIYTDLVDLLRINRIYWRDTPYEVEAYVYVCKKENINFRSNWNGRKNHGKYN